MQKLLLAKEKISIRLLIRKCVHWSDLLSQAEHDKLARAILVTDSEELANQVEAELDRQLKELPREEIARASIENNGRIILAPSKEAMFELMN